MNNSINIKQKDSSKTSAAQKIIQRFINNPYHDWIISDRTVMRGFQMLFESISEEIATKLLRMNEFIFLIASGELSCTLSASEKVNIVIIFPDLLKLLNSGSPSHGAAVIAHELGHMYFNHNIREISNLEAQYEADYFATNLGFGHELLSILQNYPKDYSCQMRCQKILNALKEH